VKNTKRLLLSYLSLISILFSQDYIWPVKLGKAISSNFGEFRPRRFHSGIDIKTNGKTGYEVFAIDDGYIWRIRVSSDGYGRTLYVKLNDGNTVVYAHLDRFSPLINDIVKREQERLSSYAMERYFAPDDFAVQKGDLLGYSGESGRAFGPHLHFELRDSIQQPLNPLTSGFSISDRHLPVPEALAIVPLSTDAIINGSPLPQIFPLRQTKAGGYEFPDTIHVFGTIGLEISAIDRITGFPNKFNIQGAVLSADGFDQYRIEFDQFAFDQAHLVEIERDNSFLRLNDGEFHRLFTVHHSEPLNFIKQNSKGQLNLTPGYHRILIRLFDHAKNVVRISGFLYVAPPIKIKATVKNKNPERLSIVVQPDGSPFPIKEAVCYSFNERGYVEEKIEPIELKQEGKVSIFDIPRSLARHRILQIIGIDKLGAVSLPFHIPVDIHEANPMDLDIDYSITHLENSVLIQLETRGYLSNPPEMFLQGQNKEDQISLIQTRPTTFLSPPLEPERLMGTREITISIHGSPTWESRLLFKPKLATPQNTSAAVSPDGYCSLQTLPSTFYDTTAFWIENVSHPVPVNGGKFISKTYQLQPFDRPLMDSARVAISLPKSVHNPSGLGIFYYDQKKGWSFLPSRFSKNKWMFFSSIYSLEAVAIIQDTIKPVITNIFPGQGGRYDSQDIMLFSANVDDNLSGIGNDLAILLTLDGQNLIFEFLPVKKMIVYRLDESLDEGEHFLTISASDQVGNSITQTINFFVN